VHDFITFNPHLSLVARWNDEVVASVKASNLGWKKWKTSDPTIAWWYTVETFQRYMSAHIARDQDSAHHGRRVRHFVSELRGLSRPPTQAKISAETETAAVALETYFQGGRPAIDRLLESCQRHSKAPKPEILGLVGADHLRSIFVAAGVGEESF